jgi:hypothetical protein
MPRESIRYERDPRVTILTIRVVYTAKIAQFKIARFGDGAGEWETAA